MVKALVFILVLFCCSTVPTSGQTKTEAQRLLQEGLDLTGAGQLPQAVRVLEDAIKLDPQYADAYAALGRAYFKMREWQMAVDNLHRAAALNKQREASLVKPEKQKVAAIALIPTPQLPPPTTPDPIPTATPILLPPPVVETKQTPPEITEEEKTTEALPVKTEPASTPEEKQEPTGVTVSLSAPPPSTPIENSSVSPIPLKPSSEDVSLTRIYRVGPGDVLDVRINEAQPQQSTLFTVTATGLLEHPILAEPLNVSALTPEEIQTRLQDDLKQRAVIENPVVTVGVRDYASHTILVSGLVKDSGTKVLRREAIPLYVVVADAQPLPEAARVTVVRNALNQMFEIELTEVADMSLLVRPGDVINLQPNETEFIYVGGEVKAPGEKIFRRGLTLTQAIISAGGMTPKSKVAEIGRDDGEGFLTKMTFKLKDIQSGKAIDPLIKPGDRIMVLR